MYEKQVTCVIVMNGAITCLKIFATVAERISSWEENIETATLSASLSGIIVSIEKTMSDNTLFEVIRHGNPMVKVIREIDKP